MIKPLPLSSLNRPIEEFVGRRGSYVLDAPYQRGPVWDICQKQNLVLSLLQGLPIGAIVTNVRPWNEEHPEVYAAVVDGRQRIETLRAFVDGDFAVPAAWFGPDARGTYIEATCGLIDYDGRSVEGVRFPDLTKAARRHFLNKPVNVTEGSLATIEAEADLYRRINFAGTAQTAADLDRASAIADAGKD